MATAARVAQLIHLIHRARVGQRSWRTVLHQIARLAPEGRAALTHRDASTGGGSFALAAGFDRSASEAYSSHYARVSPLRDQIAMSPVGRVMRYEQALPPRRFRRSEFYNDFLRPLGVETGLWVTLKRRDGDSYLLALIAPALGHAEAARVEGELAALVGPLQEAFELPTCRLGEMLGRAAPLLFGHGGLMRVGPRARVLFADRRALGLAQKAEGLSIDGAGRLVAADPALGAAVDAALAGWSSGVPFSAVHHLRRPDTALPLRLTVLRPDPDEAAFFSGPQCLLVLEDPGAGLAEAVETFGDFHGLTRAQRRVVLGIVEGWTVDGIAARHGTAIGTVRRQLKQVFERSGLSSQVALTRHVCLMVAPAGAPAQPVPALAAAPGADSQSIGHAGAAAAESAPPQVPIARPILGPRRNRRAAPAAP